MNLHQTRTTKELIYLKNLSWLVLTHEKLKRNLTVKFHLKPALIPNYLNEGKTGVNMIGENPSIFKLLSLPTKMAALLSALTRIREREHLKKKLSFFISVYLQSR